ncbi:hypothetical protein D3C73_1531600 [compost metagenome]
MRVLSTVHLVTYNTFSILYRNFPNSLLNIDNADNDQYTYKNDRNRFNYVHEVLTLNDKLGLSDTLNVRWNSSNDPGKDNQ